MPADPQAEPISPEELLGAMDNLEARAMEGVPGDPDQVLRLIARVRQLEEEAREGDLEYLALIDRADAFRMERDELRERVKRPAAKEAELHAMTQTALSEGVRTTDLEEEIDQLKSWPGLMSILDEVYPESTFDGSSGDPGPRIIVLLRRVDALEAEAVRDREALLESLAALSLRAQLERKPMSDHATLDPWTVVQAELLACRSVEARLESR